MQLCGVPPAAAADLLLVVELDDKVIHKRYTDMEEGAAGILGQPYRPNDLVVYQYPSKDAGPNSGGQPVLIEHMCALPQPHLHLLRLLMVHSNTC